jgi:LCP family protein required for cell wall assembly
LNFLGQIGSLLLSGDRQLQGEQNDRVNLVLLGIGGGDHDGANLTDTIILLSYKLSTKQLAMMSLPRDLYVKIPGVGWNKINAVNAYAEKEEKKSGGEATRQFLSDLLGAEINYYTIIDFSGFSKLVDEFGGVDVCVDNDLIDNEYPIAGRENTYPIESRYEKLVIKKGCQHMDGTTALKYARSRHALGAEGSDFARSKRQQKILLALRDKISQYNFLLNPNKISSLLEAYDKNINTNLQMWEILKLGKLIQEADYEHPITYNLTDGNAPLLYDQMVNGAYALLPYGGNYDKIKFVWGNIFTVGTSTITIDHTKWAEFKESTSSKATTTPATSTPVVSSSTPAISDPFSNEKPTPKPVIEAAYQNEGAKIAIQNGTAIDGWAGQEAAKLRAKGFTVASVGNAASRGYTSTKIYDFSEGKYSLTVSELQVLYGATATPPPAGLKANSDILIILGK